MPLCVTLYRRASSHRRPSPFRNIRDTGLDALAIESFSLIGFLNGIIFACLQALRYILRAVSSLLFRHSSNDSLHYESAVWWSYRFARTFQKRTERIVSINVDKGPSMDRSTQALKVGNPFFDRVPDIAG